MIRHRVLVVEDDDEIRDALVDVLEDHGCDAVTATNGQHALTYLRNADDLPCLILLDLMMPVMDGQAFREAQLQDPKLAQIPVVVLSAYHDAQSAAERLQAKTFLQKPPRISELVSAVAAHC